MTDPVPSNVCPVCDTPDGDHLDWCTPQVREQRASKELLPEVTLTPEQEARAALLNDFITLAGWWRRAAGLIVHLQDRVKEMERIIARDDTTTSYKCNECGAWHLRKVEEASQPPKPAHEREPETVPTAWMRGHRSYSPGEPDDYDVECVYGDDPPDDSGKWIPLYRRPAQSQSSDACPKGGAHEWVYRRGYANSFCDKCGFFPGPSQPPGDG